jgi:hypothetical protein
MKVITLLLLSLTFITGCSSSSPTPKPFTWQSSASSSNAQQTEQQAEAQNPCSPANLKTASEAQKKKCDPTRGMQDSLSPKPATQPKKKN